MKPVPAEIIEKTLSRMWSMSESEAFRLSHEMQKEQPVLVAYLASVDCDLLNEAEKEILFYYGSLVWQIMKASGQTLPKISEESILNFEKANLLAAESLRVADNVTFLRVITSLLEGYNQQLAFRYVIGALMEEDKESEKIRDESVGPILMDLKTVIDCFDSEK